MEYNINVLFIFNIFSPQVYHVSINLKMYIFFFTLSRSASSERKFPPPSRDSSSSRVLSSSYSWTSISAVGSKSWSSDDKEPTEGENENGRRRVSGTQRKNKYTMQIFHTPTKQKTNSINELLYSVYNCLNLFQFPGLYRKHIDTFTLKIDLPGLELPREACKTVEPSYKSMHSTKQNDTAFWV